MISKAVSFVPATRTGSALTPATRASSALPAGTSTTPPGAGDGSPPFRNNGGTPVYAGGVIQISTLAARPAPPPRPGVSARSMRVSASPPPAARPITRNSTTAARTPHGSKSRHARRRRAHRQAAHLLGHALAVGRPQLFGARIVGPDGQPVLQRRQRPVGEAAAALQPAAGGDLGNGPEARNGEPRRARDRRGEREQHRHVRPRRQGGQYVEQRDRHEHAQDHDQRTQARPQPLPEQGRPGQPEQGPIALGGGFAHVDPLFSVAVQWLPVSRSAPPPRGVRRSLLPNWEYAGGPTSPPPEFGRGPRRRRRP